MAGGRYELTAAAGGTALDYRTNAAGATVDSDDYNVNYKYFEIPASKPHVNIYPWSKISVKPVWSISSDDAFYSNDTCTWDMCGGQALHETKSVQSVAGKINRGMAIQRSLNHTVRHGLRAEHIISILT